ncbi:MAG TPA: hypothetical protein VIG08_10265 [Gemmatimonadales bacterium]|jgi:hypothetical protein
MSEWEQDEQEIVIPKRRPLGKLLLWTLLLAGVAVGLWYLVGRLRNVAPTVVAVAHNVHTDVTGVGDSLDVIVSWAFADTAGTPQPDSARLEVGLEGTDPNVVLLPSRQRSDTLRIAAPPTGSTGKGHSCVSGVYRSRLSGESCTPWEFVRPAVEKGTAKPASRDSTTQKPSRSTGGGKTPTVLRLVVRPAGRQVDPDVGGKCAAWQQSNPGESVWIAVNEKAVPNCTGPNGKPTVAQFCAFAVLEDGERVKTENSINNPYCETLFQAWVRERIS